MEELDGLQGLYELPVKADFKQNKFIRKYWNTGDLCKQYQQCQLLHHVAAIVSVGCNDHFMDYLSDHKDRINLSPEEQEHLKNLTSQWRREFIHPT